MLGKIKGIVLCELKGVLQFTSPELHHKTQNIEKYLFKIIFSRLI